MRAGRSEGGLYVDALPAAAYPGGLFVLVSGRIMAITRPSSASGGSRLGSSSGGVHAAPGMGAGGPAVCLAFSETFLLMPTGGPGEFWVANQAFRVLHEPQDMHVS